MLCQDSIKARLGGVGLPPTIEQADEGVAHLSDQISMETDLGNLIGMGHAGVGALPVGAVGDGGVHEAFDLSHVGCGAVDFLKIQRIGVLREKSGQLGLWHTEHQISDGVGDTVSTTPADRLTRRGAHPDHAFLSPLLSDAVGGVNVRCPVATPLIQVLPGGGLNGEASHGISASVVRILRCRS